MTAGKLAARTSRAARKRLNGLEVLYKRGAFTCSPIATIGTTRRDQQSADGLISKKQVRDFLIDVADLVLDGAAVEPQRDDVIEETDGETVFVYWVQSPGGSEPAWRYSDRHRITWRIHGQLIEERPAE